MKIYNVFQVSGMGYYMYMATCKTREAANKYIANLCKKRPDVFYYNTRNIEKYTQNMHIIRIKWIILKSRTNKLCICPSRA